MAGLQIPLIITYNLINTSQNRQIAKSSNRQIAKSFKDSISYLYMYNYVP
jgi:hypothetical protein